jgi:hypothetical protein
MLLEYFLLNTWWTLFAAYLDTSGIPRYSRIFDLLQRTGFKIVFVEINGNGKTCVLTATSSPETARGTAETNYSFLLKVLGNGVFAIRIFIDQGLEEVPIPRI